MWPGLLDPMALSGIRVSCGQPRVGIGAKMLVRRMEIDTVKSSETPSSGKGEREARAGGKAKAAWWCLFG